MKQNSKEKPTEESQKPTQINITEDYIDTSNPDFVDNFNKLLEESHERYKERLKLTPYYPNEYNNQEENDRLLKESQIKVRRQKTSERNIFTDPPSWKPANGYGKEFDELKILKHKVLLNDWDIYRTRHLIKRSYYKEEEELGNGKHPFLYINSNGDEFEKGININSRLSENGKRLLSRFINENNMRIKERIKREKEVFDYQHSKPKYEMNGWRMNSTQLKEFSKSKIDDVHSFIKEVRQNHNLHPPFKRTKIDGDYFNRIDLSQEFSKYVVK